MSLALSDIIATMAKVRAEHGKLDPARIAVHSVDDWRTACLLAGVEPVAHDPEPGSGGLCAAFHGVPVIVAPAICNPGEIVVLRGLGANELAGSYRGHVLLGIPRIFELTWEVVR